MKIVLKVVLLICLWTVCSEPASAVFTFKDSPAVSSWGENRLDVFVRGDDDALWHKWWDGSHWSSWDNLGGILTSSPAAVSMMYNRIDVFVRGTDNGLWHKWWDGSKWNNWESFGGYLTSAPVARAYSDKILEIYAKGADDDLVYITYNRDGTKGGWGSYGGKWTDAPGVQSMPYMVDSVLVKGTENALYQLHVDAPEEDIWSSEAEALNVWWEPLGGILTSAPAASSWAPNRLDVFARGADNALWHKWWDGSGRGWGEWESLGGILTSAPAAVSWGYGRIDVFVKGTDNGLWHMWRDGSSSWSGWESFIDVASPLTSTSARDRVSSVGALAGKIGYSSPTTSATDISSSKILAESSACKPPYETICNEECTDIQSNPNNCGSCGIVCPSGERCINGKCQSCQLCGNSCVYLQSDDKNCGSCGNECNIFQSCVNGICKYPVNEKPVEEG